MTRKKTEPAEVIRSKSWMSQPEFDNLIRDIDISSLRFLKWKYKDDIQHMKNSLNLNDSENMHMYKQMEQRYKMISEELRKRYHDTILLDDRDIHFSKNHDFIISEDKHGRREIWVVSLDDVGLAVKKIGNVRDEE